MTANEAASKIEKLTGIKRGLTRVKKFLKSLGMKPRKVGMILAKSDPEKQDIFLKKPNPRLKEAKDGKRVVLFVDVARFA